MAQPLTPIKPSLPRCPVSWLVGVISYPSITISFGLIALVSFIFAIIALVKYNSVKVFKRRIRRKSVSNTFWIAYFICIGLRATCQTVYYAIVSQERRYMDNLFELFVLIMNGVSAFALSLALNHQRRYRTKDGEEHIEEGNGIPNYATFASSYTYGRSGGKPVPTSLPPAPEYDELLRNDALSVNNPGQPSEPWLKRILISVEALFFLIFLLYLVGLYLKVANVGNHPQEYDITFLALFVAQRIPAVVLVCVIVFTGACDPTVSHQQRGPSKLSKVGLCFGLVLNLLNEMPVDIWTEIVGHAGCVFVVASLLDLVNVLFLLSLVIYFLFLRAEFKRNVEDCLWQSVTEQQVRLRFEGQN